eukprot:TRINITY_DN4879_c0_g1_i1.p1 TRINITY_DN4879_c0_g1~~TRINITY_DN4879_c0_g1_i1.p1  ORF type:complete len:470 (+),score=130.96 TRINITY_DN4879_c0_g1_i1:85-1494(+)
MLIKTQRNIFALHNSSSLLKSSRKYQIKRVRREAYQRRVLKRGYTVSEDLIKMEKDFSANNYDPLPVVIDRSDRVSVWDPEGVQYYDFLSGYSALNQGHNHPKIIKALTEQAGKCALTSRAFYNSVYPKYAEYVTKYFGYESVLPMNTGAEAVDSALKLARKWGYVKKGIPKDEAIIISATESFHGRTFAAISLAKFDTNEFFGPDLGGIIQIEYNSVDAMKDVLEKYGDKVAAVILEPIQGEAGVCVPDEGYITSVSALCKEHNVLFIDDEIQTGIARTGKLLAVDHENVRPDIVLLGKAISGGVYPVSAVLADNEVMDVLNPGDHGSTYGGNPIASAVAMAALDVVRDENLADKAMAAGEVFRNTLRKEAEKYDFILEVRGKGLLNAVVIDPDYDKSAKELCLILKANGLLAKPTHENIIRFSPPLIITEEEMQHALSIITHSLAEFGGVAPPSKERGQKKSMRSFP